MSEYVPDRLYERLFQPWRFRAPDWPLCQEDWTRVDTITRFPWCGSLVDFGSGDGTLAAMVCSRNPLVYRVELVEQDASQTMKALHRWKEWPLYEAHNWTTLDYDGALCCEVLEHLTPEEGERVLLDIKRALKPGAMICATVPCAGGSRDMYPGHIRSFDEFALRDELDRLGFGKIVSFRIDRIWYGVTALA